MMKIKRDFLENLFTSHRKRAQWYRNPPPKYSPPVTSLTGLEEAGPPLDIFVPKPTLRNPHLNYRFSYKGQIHAHSNYDPSWRPRWLGGEEDDGDQTPQQVEQAYLDKGYKFICLTGHSVNTPDPEVPGIVHIPSVESGYGCRHHLLGLDIGAQSLNVDLMNDTCYCDEIQDRINWIRNRLGIAVIAHPMASHSGGWPHLSCGSGWSLDDVATSIYYHGIEIFTNSLDSRYCWDWVLSSGRRVWGFGVDDCHDVNRSNHVSFNRSWIVVNSDAGEEDEDALRQDIAQNIKDGNFYSVLRSPDKQRDEDTGSDGPSDYIGPALHLSVFGNKIQVIPNEVSIITFVIHRSGTSWQPESHIYFSSADSPTIYTLDGSEDWARVEILQARDNEAYLAVSQPLIPRFSDT